MASSLTIRRPDDWHVHLRDGEVMQGVLPYTARQFVRAIVMPNLSPPVVTAADATAYRERILAALPEGADFTPLMTAYLTDHSDPDDLARGHAEGAFTAAKLYPAHATTGSAHGVTDIANIHPRARANAAARHAAIDPRRSHRPRSRHLRPRGGVHRAASYTAGAGFPALRIVFEHATTEDAVAFVDAAGPNVAATITPQHLHINRNAMLVGGIRPHAYCLPVAKRERHRLALRRAATSGSHKYFLGTDSAPHAKHLKEHACGCAGIFNAPFALESYAAVFEEEGALDRFEAFASENGPDSMACRATRAR